MEWQSSNEGVHLLRAWHGVQAPLALQNPTIPAAETQLKLLRTVFFAYAQICMGRCLHGHPLGILSMLRRSHVSCFLMFGFFFWVGFQSLERAAWIIVLVRSTACMLFSS